MKKLSLLLALVLLLTVAGCRKQEDPPEVEKPPVEELEDPAPQGPLQLDELRLEITRYDGDTALVLRAARELPDLLQRYFAEVEAPVEIGKVRVTVGSSAGASAQSLAQGGIDLAFLPAETIALSGDARVLLGNAPQPAIRPYGDSKDVADWNDSEKSYVAGHDVWTGGTMSLICAAPTEYGRQLANRAESGKALTWEELDRARWGVLETTSDGGYRCADLYLADSYEGDRISDLSDVTKYDSYEALLRAAAEETVDVIVLRADARMDVAAAWTLEFSRADQSGMQGFARTKPVWEEVRCLAVTETLYTTVAAVAPEQEDLTGEAFCEALAEVLERLYDEEPELMGALGSAHFAPIEDEDLDALRRTLTIEGRTT